MPADFVNAMYAYYSRHMSEVKWHQRTGAYFWCYRTDQFKVFIVSINKQTKTTYGLIINGVKASAIILDNRPADPRVTSYEWRYEPSDHFLVEARLLDII